MKIRINKWLGCGLACALALGLGGTISRASARRNSYRNYQNWNIQPVSHQRRSSVSVSNVTSIPNQGYTNYVTGQNALYSQPGTLGNARIIYNRRAMQNFAKRRIRFMTYQRAVTNRGSVYYKIVSLRHSVRGWMYQDAIRSMLNRQQQAADFTFGSQILHAEMVADQDKHESLASRSRIDLEDANSIMSEAKGSVRQLKGTPDYSAARTLLRGGQSYLRRIAKVQPSSKTLRSLASVRSEYNRAAKDVSDAQTASLNHHNRIANRRIKGANQSLRHVSQILNQIRNRHDRRVAMALFNHAWSYVNKNYSFDPTNDLSGRNLNTRRSSNPRLVSLIKQDEINAQNSIMDLYPHLDNFDIALTDANRAQNDLNRANDLVTRLKGAHVRKAELNDIELTQHNVNDLWNV